VTASAAAGISAELPGVGWTAPQGEDGVVSGTKITASIAAGLSV
jgi:hypothetical protein